MLLMGDEVRRSQGGNNNTWCQNNPLGWMHWQPDAGDLALRTYVQRLLQWRQRLVDLLNPELPLPERPQRRNDDSGHLWRQWHGVEVGRPDWAAWSHTLAWSINESVQGPLLWCGMNAYSRAIHFDLPVSTSGWMRVIDTALPPGEELPAAPLPWKPAGFPLESRSLVLLVSRRLLQERPAH
jgi:glycogen operon protein